MSPDSVKLTDDESKCRAAGPNLSIIYSYVCGMLPFLQFKEFIQVQIDDSSSISQNWALLIINLDEDWLLLFNHTIK